MPVRRRPLPLACSILAICLLTGEAAFSQAQPGFDDASASMVDGTVLPLHRWLPSGEPRAVIVALHGMNDYGASFASTGEYLAANGFAVYAFDQRGFGAAEQRGTWAGGTVLADDARQVAQLLRMHYPSVPLYGLGESMGGAVLLLALARHPHGWIDAAVVLAPAVWNRRQMRWYERSGLWVFAHATPGMRLSSRLAGRTPSDDPETLRRLREDPLMIRKTRADALWGVADLMDAVTAEPAQFAVPLLVLYGARDEIVPPSAICTWIGSLATRGAQFAVYPSGWHLLTRGLDALTVHRDLAAWFERPGTALPSGLDTPDSPFCVGVPADQGWR